MKEKGSIEEGRASLELNGLVGLGMIVITDGRDLPDPFSRSLSKRKRK